MTEIAAIGRAGENVAFIAKKNSSLFLKGKAVGIASTHFLSGMRFGTCVLFLLLTFVVEAQELKFKPLVDSIIGLDQPLAFEDMRLVSRPMRRDIESLNYFKAEAKRIQNCRLEAYATDLMGKFFRNNSRFEEALALHDEVILLAEGCKDSVMLATGFNGKGVVYRRQNLVSEAIDAHGQALAKAKQVVNIGYGALYAQSVALNSLGNIYLSMELWDQAEKEFLRSLVIQDSIGNQLGVAINNQNLGDVYVGRNAPDSALAFFKESLRINTEIGSEFGQMLSHIAIAEIYSETGRAEEAMDIMKEAFPTAKASGDPYHTALAYLVMGEVMYSMKQFNAAKSYLEAGLTLADTHEFLSHQAKAHRLCGKVDSVQGNYVEALQRFQQSSIYEARLLSQRNNQVVGSFSASLEAQRNRNEIERLAQENEFVKERSRRTRTLLIAIITGLVFLAGFLIVLSRQRSIIYDRDLAHLEQQRLSSQMNPHFLFNALNSVKAFMIDNERKAAINYLDNFAKLVRRILQSSIDETVSLTQELENCRLYVSIENARLNNEVIFTEDIGPGIELGNVKVPPLLLQPFLENAFWHGLQSKQGEKTLTITVRQELNKEQAGRLRTIISIVDNGVGRHAARMAKARHARHRRSVGVDLTRKRLDFYAKQMQVEASFTTHDLVAPDGGPKGTEVKIILG